MKEKLKTVYYCEFCKKYRLTRNSMYFHERSCTLNPDRVCRVSRCSNHPDVVPRYAKGECPWCVFSRKRLTGNMWEYVDFDVKGQMEEWWGRDERWDERDDAAYEAINQ